MGGLSHLCKYCDGSGSTNLIVEARSVVANMCSQRCSCSWSSSLPWGEAAEESGGGVVVIGCLAERRPPGWALRWALRLPPFIATCNLRTGVSPNDSILVLPPQNAGTPQSAFPRQSTRSMALMPEQGAMILTTRICDTHRLARNDLTLPITNRWATRSLGVQSQCSFVRHRHQCLPPRIPGNQRSTTV